MRTLDTSNLKRVLDRNGAVVEDFDYEELGRRIHNARRNKGLTQTEISEMTGLSQTYISHVELALCRISLFSLRRISQALGVPSRDLLVGLLD